MLLACLMVLLAIAGGAENPSALLDRTEYEETTSHKQLVCPVKYVIEQGRVRTRTLFYPMAEVVSNISRYAMDQLTASLYRVRVWHGRR